MTITNGTVGINERLIHETPLAVIDLETTGLYPGGDRIVELAVVRVEPGKRPAIAIDTLVNPRRPVAATEIHGITDADVADAPTFEHVADALTSALAGCVVASYNVYFDVKFVQAEWAAIGIRCLPPHLCLMYMRPLLGLGARCSLGDACRAHAIVHQCVHWAAADAMASAQLWSVYSEAITRRGLRSFADLSKLKAYKFLASWNEAPLDAPIGARAVVFKSRGSTLAAFLAAGRPTDRQQLVGEYWDALTSVLADLQITPTEVDYVRSKQSVLRLTNEELRWLHARAFAGILADVCRDKAVSVDEALCLHTVAGALRELGWAPGDLADSGAVGD